MASVLAIDAAWTGHQPSGVALLAERPGAWECVALAASYADFLKFGNADSDIAQSTNCGSFPNPGSLIQTARALLNGAELSLVTADIPLAVDTIVCRRTADNEISERFGAKWCGTHSPNAKRPGPISNAISHGFLLHGFPLATISTAPGCPKKLLEVFPHVALLRLLVSTKRICYKVSKSTKYWRGQLLASRRKLLLEQFNRILDALSHDIRDIPLQPSDFDQIPTLSGLKCFEDKLDALVCGWMGMQYLRRKATAYGDESAAIWVPSAI